jgi:hypothetical protein
MNIIYSSSFFTVIFVIFLFLHHYGKLKEESGNELYIYYAVN